MSLREQPSERIMVLLMGPLSAYENDLFLTSELLWGFLLDNVISSSHAPLSLQSHLP